MINNQPSNKKSLFKAADGSSYLLPFILVTSLFLLWGFAHGLLDILNKHFQSIFTMSKAESGLVQFVTYIAYFLMALPAGSFMKRFGFKSGIIFGLSLFALGSFSFIPAVMIQSATPFLIALFIIACGLCFLETAANPYSTILGPSETAAQRLNLSQSFNGLGWILGPLVGGIFIFGTNENDIFSLAKPYMLIGTIVIFVAIIFCFIKLPEVKGCDSKESLELNKTITQNETSEISLWKSKQFIHAVIAQFCYCAAQTGIFSFFINYVTELDTSITNEQASRFLAFGGMALFMLGRLSGSYTMKWFKPSKILAYYSLTCIICMGLVMAAVETLSIYALYLSFFFMSIMFPTIFALGVINMGEKTKKASSYIVMSVAGGAFSPMLMGYIGKTDMAIGFIIPLIAFIYIFYFACSCKTE